MPNPSNDNIRVFTSSRHPKGSSAAAVYAQAMGIPVGVCSIPVMLFGLAAALLEQRLFPELAVGMAIALGVAWLWTHFSLRRQVAEIFIRNDAAAVRSVHQSLNNKPLRWKRVFQVKRRPDHAEAAIGRDEVTFRAKAWPRFDLLVDELDAATFSPFRS